MPLFSGKLFIASLTGLLLTACSIPSPEKKEEGNATGTFYVNAVQGEFTSTKKHSLFSIPISRTLSVKACFHDNKNSKPVLHHKFEIQNPQRTVELTTDNEGCVLWQEEIQYNALSDAKLIKISRQAKALGQEKGTRQIELLINPWGNSVLSLKGAQVRENSYVAESTEALNGASEFQRPISFDQGRITLQPLATRGETRRMSLDVIGAISVETKNLEGQVSPLLLTSGKFKYEFVFFYQSDQDAEGKKHLIYQSPELELRQMTQGQINFNHEFDLTDGALCSTGTVYFGLKLIPLEGPEGLKKLETVFHYGPCETRGTVFATQLASFRNQQERDRHFSIARFIQQDSAEDSRASSVTSDAPTSPNSQIPLSPGTSPGSQLPAPTQPGVRPPQPSGSNRSGTSRSWAQISPLRFDTISYSQNGGVERKRNLQISACVRSSQDQRPLRLTTLQVETLSGEKRTIRATDNDGCFTFDDQVTYNYFGQECWIQSRIVVSNPASRLPQEVPVLYNPWADQDAFRDLSRVNASNETSPRCANGKSEIILQSFDFKKRLIGYNVDQYLNLEVQKTGPFTLKLSMKRPSLSQGSSFSEEVVPPNVQFLLRLAVVDQYLNNLSESEGKIYSFQEKIVSVRGASEIAEELTLATKNIKARGNTNRLFIEILPLKSNTEQLRTQNPQVELMDLVDLNTNIVRKVFTSALQLSNDNEAGSLIEFKSDEDAPSQLRLNASSQGLDLLKEQWIKDQEQNNQRLARTSSPQHFAQDQELILVKATDEAASLALRTAVTNPADVLRGLPPRERPLAQEGLLELIDKGSVHDVVKTRLCHFWFQNLWMRPLAGKNHGVLDSSSSLQTVGLIGECLRQARANPKQIFDIETKYFIKKADFVEVSEVAVPVRDFSVSYGFSMDRSQSTSVTRSFTWDLSLGARGMFLFSPGSGIGYSVNRSTSTASGQSASASFSASTALTIETLGLKIKSDSYEKCLVIRLNPALFIQGRNSAWKQALSVRLTAEEKVRAVKLGLLLCEGVEKTEGRLFDEKYYVLNQNLPAGASQLDTSTNRNRPFFTAIRGELDFIKFIGFLHQSQNAPAVFNDEYLRSRIGEEPLNSLFLRGSPSYPGVFTRQE